MRTVIVALAVVSLMFVAVAAKTLSTVDAKIIAIESVVESMEFVYVVGYRDGYIDARSSRPPKYPLKFKVKQ